MPDRLEPSANVTLTDFPSCEKPVTRVLVRSSISPGSAWATQETLDFLGAALSRVHAEFPALSFSPGIDVPLTAAISLERSEWERWSSGAPPRVLTDGCST